MQSVVVYGHDSRGSTTNNRFALTRGQKRSRSQWVLLIICSKETYSSIWAYSSIHCTKYKEITYRQHHASFTVKDIINGGVKRKNIQQHMPSVANLQGHVSPWASCLRAPPRAPPRKHWSSDTENTLMDLLLLHSNLWNYISKAKEEK